MTEDFQSRHDDGFRMRLAPITHESTSVSGRTGFRCPECKGWVTDTKGHLDRYDEAYCAALREIDEASVVEKWIVAAAGTVVMLMLFVLIWWLNADVNQDF